MPFYIKKPSNIKAIRGMYATLDEVCKYIGGHVEFAEDEGLLSKLAISEDCHAQVVMYAKLPDLVSQIKLPEKPKVCPPNSNVNVNTATDGLYLGGHFENFKFRHPHWLQ